jgi:D-amino-acid dehydrogenase
MSPAKTARVVVIGGGVIGAACAHFLHRAGWVVTVIDQGTFGGGCSHANCGLVTPSHVLPLAVPGAVTKSLRALFEKNAPFSIKPRLDPDLWAWLLRFARRCNTRDMLEAGRAIHALLDSSRALYGDLFRNEPLDAEWTTRGVLFVFSAPQAMERFAETDRLLRERFGVGATRYDGEALMRLEPTLKPDLAGGWHYEMDAHLRPDRLMSSWRNLLEGRGVAIRERCALRSFIRGGESMRAKAVDTACGRIEADAFVVATGAWTPQLNNDLGWRAPIQPGKGYSLTMPRPRRCPAIPMIFEERRVAVTPMQSGFRLGSIMEFAGYDTSLDPQRLELLRSAAAEYLVEPAPEAVVERWFGWRPMTSDGKPVIDRSPAFKNVVIAAGHNMLGLSMAPATGKLVAELLSGHTPHIDPAPYAVRGKF